LYEFGFRLYDPWAGIWLTREPLPAQSWQPLTWHRYQYAYASPISYYDAYGLQAWFEKLSQRFGWLLDCAKAVFRGYLIPFEGFCSPSGYSPRAANTQACWILASWFFEIGPEVQWYGPKSPFTHILRHHMGVQRFRAEWAAAGYPPIYPLPGQPPKVWRIEEAAETPRGAYLQENIKLILSFAGHGSPTPEGLINPLGGVVGSYEFQILKINEDTAMFIVKNETEWESGTRMPGTGYSLLPPLKRSETNWATTLVLVAEARLIPIVVPVVIAYPELAQPIKEINKAILELAKIAPGEWGGVGGRMVQYYWWTEPIPSEGRP